MIVRAYGDLLDSSFIEGFRQVLLESVSFREKTKNMSLYIQTYADTVCDKGLEDFRFEPSYDMLYWILDSVCLIDDEPLVLGSLFGDLVDFWHFHELMLSRREQWDQTRVFQWLSENPNSVDELRLFEMELLVSDTFILDNRQLIDDEKIGLNKIIVDCPFVVKDHNEVVEWKDDYTRLFFYWMRRSLTYCVSWFMVQTRGFFLGERFDVSVICRDIIVDNANVTTENIVFANYWVALMQRAGMNLHGFHVVGRQNMYQWLDRVLLDGNCDDVIDPDSDELIFLASLGSYNITDRYLKKSLVKNCKVSDFISNKHNLTYRQLITYMRDNYC